MVVIVDYDTGNLGSIKNMLKKVGMTDVVISSDPEVLADASKLILPGVGSFDIGMSKLRERGLVEPLNDMAIEKKTPVLGICLGMQLFMEGSEEGRLDGLGWIPGRCVRFALPKESGLKVPHMGWNAVRDTMHSDLFAGQPEDFRFYFVHSYHVQCSDEAHVAGWTHHGYEFACAVARGNIWGTQFHPEKSHKFGMRVLKNFVERD